MSAQWRAAVPRRRGCMLFHRPRNLCRYVVANAVRPGMLDRAEDWPYCGLSSRSGRPAKLPVSRWPVDRPRDWIKLVNAIVDDQSLASLRESVNGGKPYGSEQWVALTARRLGLEFTLRAPGRPAKAERQNNQ